MLATPLPDSAAPSRLLGASAAELKFRIQGGEHNGRILRITAVKCTIGSAPGCTLRLRGGDFEPLHCLILAGRNGTIIRRNSPRTYLNGGPFEDAALKLGDVLRIGSMEMAVVACPQAASALQPRSQPVSESTELGFYKQDQRRLAAELAAMGEVLRAAQEQLEQVERKSTEAITEQTRSLSQRREQQAQDLENLLRQHREERAASQSREERLQTELRQSQQRNQELESRQAQREIESQQQVEDKCQEVQTLQQAIRAELEQRDQERATSAAQRQQLEEKLAAVENDLLQSASELSSQREACTNATEQVRALDCLLQEGKQKGQERQQLEEQRQQEQLREQQEFAAARSQLEVVVATLTQQLRHREAELETAQQRGVECADTRTHSLDEALSEIRDLQSQQTRNAEEYAASRAQVEERIADLTARLIEREKELAHRDEELLELRQRAAHLSAADLMVKQLEETLANSALAQQAEREAWQQARSELEGRRSELESQQNELLIRRDELAAQCSSRLVEIGNLQSRYSELENSRNELLTSVDQASDREAAERWQAEAHHWQLQAEERASQISQLTQRSAILENEIVELKGVVLSADLEATQKQSIEDLSTQLELQRKELAEARSILEAEQSQHEQSLTEASSREEVLARKEADLREREAAWEVARGEQVVALEERSKLIASQIAHFEAEQAAHTRQQATIIHQMSFLEDRVQELTTASESRSTNSPFVIPKLDDPSLMEGVEPAEQPYIRADARQVEAAGTPVNQPQEMPTSPSAEVALPEPVSEANPIEEDSVVNRLKQAGLWKGSDSNFEEGSIAPAEDVADDVQPSPEQAVETTAVYNPPPAGNHDDEDSIEQYMSRLLNRVRGGNTPVAGSQAPVVSQPAAAKPAPAKNAEVGESPAEPKEYLPRAQAPELSERMSLMRELANSAANSALHTHDRQHQKRDTKQKSLVALISLIGAASLFIAACVTGSFLAWIGSIIFVAVCCVMCMRAITGGFRQMRLTQPQEIGESQGAADSAAASSQK